MKQISTDILISLAHVISAELNKDQIIYRMSNNTEYTEMFHCADCAERRFKRYISDGKLFGGASHEETVKAQVGRK